MVLPAVLLGWFSSLPKPAPQISESIKALGFSAIDGVELERKLAQDSRLSFGGEQAVIACPEIVLTADGKPGLCGYCKADDLEIYPSWLQGFTMKLEAGDFDYRHIYDDSLHKRYVMRTNNFEDIFRQREAEGWRDSMGRWFICRNSDELDVNAYIEVSLVDNEPIFVVGDYDALGIVREQGLFSG